MHIDSKDVIAGQPILKIRALLLKGKAYDGWSELFVANTLKISLRGARKVITELEEQGYIAACQFSGDKSWTNTIHGNKLSLASASKPITRDKAIQLLKQFLDRVFEVRDSPKFLYKIVDVRVFGSFIIQKQKLSDLDIWINLEPKDEQKMRLLNKRRYIQAISAGKQSIGALRAVDEPRVKVINYLKARSCYISLHIDDPIIEKCKHKIVYCENDNRDS